MSAQIDIRNDVNSNANIKSYSYNADVLKMNQDWWENTALIRKKTKRRNNSYWKYGTMDNENSFYYQSYNHSFHNRMQSEWMNNEFQSKTKNFSLERNEEESKNWNLSSQPNITYKDRNKGKSWFPKQVKRSNKRVIFKLSPSNLPPISDNKTCKFDDLQSNPHIPNFASTFTKLNMKEKNKYIPRPVNHSDEALKHKPPVKRNSGESIQTLDSNLSDSKGFLRVPPLPKRRGSTSSLCTMTTDTNSK